MDSITTAPGLVSVIAASNAGEIGLASAKVVSTPSAPKTVISMCVVAP